MPRLGRGTPFQAKRAWRPYWAPLRATAPLVASVTMGYSPEAIGEPMPLVATTVLAFSPEGIGPGAGNMPLTASVTNTATVALALPSANLVVTVVEAYSPEAVGEPMGLTANVVLAFSPEAIGLPQPLVATVTLGYSPEAVGAPGNVAVAVTLAGALTFIFPPGSMPIIASVSCAIASGSISIRLPWTQPGYQYVRSVLSYGLPDGHRVYEAVGVPSANLGNNGDYYRRSDGTGGSLMYYRASGAWTAIN